MTGPCGSERAPSPFALVAAFGAIYLQWGGTFLAIRYAVADVPPLLTMLTHASPRMVPRPATEVRP